MADEKKYTQHDIDVLTEIKVIGKDVKHIGESMMEFKTLHAQEHKALWNKFDSCSKQVEDNTKKLHGIYAIGGVVSAIFTGLIAWLKYKGE